jgi:hypothetical protein
MNTLEVEVGVQRLDLFDHFGIDLGRVAAGLQQRQHQRREFMAHRDGREAHAHVADPCVDRERGLALASSRRPGAACIRFDSSAMSVQQRLHLARSGRCRPARPPAPPAGKLR